jgi:hypothetical protein
MLDCSEGHGRNLLGFCFENLVVGILAGGIAELGGKVKISSAG